MISAKKRGYLLRTYRYYLKKNGYDSASITVLNNNYIDKLDNNANFRTTYKRELTKLKKINKKKNRINAKLKLSEFAFNIKQQKEYFKNTTGDEYILSSYEKRYKYNLSLYEESYYDDEINDLIHQYNSGNKAVGSELSRKTKEFNQKREKTTTEKKAEEYNKIITSAT